MSGRKEAGDVTQADPLFGMCEATGSAPTTREEEGVSDCRQEVGESRGGESGQSYNRGSHLHCSLQSSA